jgi:hypothetical protein
MYIRMHGLGGVVCVCVGGGVCLRARTRVCKQ